MINVCEALLTVAQLWLMRCGAAFVLLNYCVVPLFGLPHDATLGQVFACALGLAALAQLKVKETPGV